MPGLDPGSVLQPYMSRGLKPIPGWSSGPPAPQPPRSSPETSKTPFAAQQKPGHPIPFRVAQRANLTAVSNHEDGLRLFDAWRRDGRSDFDLAGVQSIDSCAIYIRARDLEPKLREASSGDDTHISTADDADVHERLFLINAGPLKVIRDEKRYAA